MRSYLIMLVFFINVHAQIQETVMDSTGTQLNRESNPTHFDKSNKDSLHPISFDTTRTGSLSISTYPANVDVFVNGVYIGKGNQLLLNIKTGMYCVNAKYESKNQEGYALI